MFKAEKTGADEAKLGKKGGDNLVNKSKLIIVTLVVVATVSAVAFGVGKVLADTGSGSSLVQMLAQKFNLNPSDVQAVFDQNRADRQAQMQEKFKANLDQAIKDGKLTTDQENLILAKHKELQDNRAAEADSSKNMTPMERQAARQKERQDLADWAKTNDIDTQYFFGGFGHRGMGSGFGMKNNQSAN